MSYKQVIVLRKDLNMRKGKMVAQGAHASMGAILNEGYTQATDHGVPDYFVIPMTYALEAWLTGSFRKICVSVNSEQEMLDLEAKAKEAGLINCLIIDSGLTEFNGIPTITALAIGPDADKEIDAITGHLPLL